MSRGTGKLNSGIPQVPKPMGDGPSSPLAAKRRDLPIWAQRQEIIQAINQNQVRSRIPLCMNFSLTVVSLR